jgi:hypothetical protein
VSRCPPEKVLDELRALDLSTEERDALTTLLNNERTPAHEVFPLELPESQHEIRRALFEISDDKKWKLYCRTKRIPDRLVPHREAKEESLRKAREEAQKTRQEIRQIEERYYLPSSTLSVASCPRISYSRGIFLTTEY